MCARIGVSSHPHFLHFPFKIKGRGVAAIVLDDDVLADDVLDDDVLADDMLDDDVLADDVLDDDVLADDVLDDDVLADDVLDDDVLADVWSFAGFLNGIPVFSFSSEIASRFNG